MWRTRVSSVLKWVDENPLRKLLAYVVAAALGLTTLIGAYTVVRDTFFKAKPFPKVIRIHPITHRELAVDLSKRSVEVVVENPSDQTLLITGVKFRTSPLPPNWFENTSGPILPSHVYRLPLNCLNARGQASLDPVFGVDPKGAAAFVIEGSGKQMRCLVFLAFETNQGRTKELLAKGF